MNTRTINAVLKRDVRSYFGSMTGYVFVLGFVVLAFLLAFRPGQDEFFPQNEATLGLLTEWFPLLLVLFVPAVTMGSWANERQQETDSLLFTLPAHDWEIVLAKFGACFTVYSAALGFTLVFVGVLEYFGDPDFGLLFSTYLGYWLLGGLAVAVGMLASSVTRNLTVAWILGAAACFSFGAPDMIAKFTVGAVHDIAVELGASQRFSAFGNGVVAAEDVLYFVGLTAAALYANGLLVGARHWTSRKGRMVHGSVRLASIAVTAGALVILAGSVALRTDVTAERMLSLTPEALAVIDALDAERPVYIQAWISKDVPQGHKATRDGLVNMLEEFDAHGGDRLHVVINATELYSDDAQRAETAFGIIPRRVQTQVQGKSTAEEIFLGLALTCGSRELTIPFFDRGLPIQYELTRAIGSVAQQKKSKVGVLASGVDLFGGFDFKTMNRSQDWQVLGDLRKQYEVEKVDGKAAVSTSIDVLVAPLPSSLPQEPMNQLAKHLYDGGKALLFCDAYPEFNRDLAPTRPSDVKKNPFQQQQGPPKPPKGNIEQLMAAMGVTWHKNRITWDDHNPHPEWEIPRELIFVVPSAGEERPSGFNETDDVTSGLQELVMIFPGELDWDRSNVDVEVTPLLWTGGQAGFHTWKEMVQESFFGIQPTPEEARIYASFQDVTITSAGAGQQAVIDAVKGLPGRATLGKEVKFDVLPLTVATGLTAAQANEALTSLEAAGAKAKVVPTRRVLAVRIKGNLRAPSGSADMPAGQLSPNTFEAIIVADMDLVSDVFYNLRSQGQVDLSLDNVTFVANCIDSLVGENSYIALRKLRPKHRTLTRYEDNTKAYKEAQREAVQNARKESEQKLAEAKDRLNAKLKAIDARGDLDPRTKRMMYEAASQSENRKLEITEQGIKDEESAKNRTSRIAKDRAENAAKVELFAWAFGASVLLPLLLGIVVLLRKSVVERAGVEQGRRR